MAHRGEINGNFFDKNTDSFYTLTKCVMSVSFAKPKGTKRKKGDES